MSFALNIGMVHRHPNANFFLPITRVWELMIGSLLAGLAIREDVPWTRSAREVLSLAGSLLTVLAFVLVDEGKQFPGWRALLPTAGAGLLICAGPQAWVNTVVLASPAAVFIGLISYPLYLWHWPALVYLNLIAASDYHPSPRAFNAVSAAAMLAAGVLAWTTWKFLETPVRRSKTIRPVFRSAALVGAMVAVVCVGAMSFKGRLRPRLDAPAIVRLRQATSDWHSSGYNNFRAPVFRVNEVIRSLSSRHRLFVGDSHMEQYEPRVVAAIAADPRLASAIVVTNGGCPPLPGLNRVEPGFRCPAFYEFWTEQARAANVGTVVIGAYWEACYLGKYMGSSTPPAPPFGIVGPSGEGAVPLDIERAWRGLESGITRLVKLGKRVVILASNPTSPAFDPALMAHRFRTPDDLSRRSVDRADFERFVALVENALNAIAARTGATVIHPIDYLCGKNRLPGHRRERTAAIQRCGTPQGNGCRTEGHLYRFDAADSVSVDSTPRPLPMLR